MSMRDDLVKARSHIVFIVALLLGLFLVLRLEWTATQLRTGVQAPTSSENEQVETLGNAKLAPFDAVEPLPLVAPRAATPEEIGYAKVAWRYFENNTDPQTGLANSANNFPSTTMWETASYFVATISAETLGLITTAEASSRLKKALQSLSAQRLFEGKLPNKAYNTKTNELVDYSNKPSEKGIGWSALDISRLIGTMYLVQKHHPELAVDVSKVLKRWDLNSLVKDGQLIGGNMADGKLRLDQEGRLGYEQYAAKSLMLAGLDLYRAYDASIHLMIQEVEGQSIPVDDRLHRNKTPAFTVSEPYVFDGLEFGFDARSHRFASAVYRAQEARFANSGILTAVSETHITEAPYFAYSTVWGGGAPWAVMSFTGDRLDSKRTIATKVAFGWNALFGTAYTQNLMKAIAPLADPEKGWPEGLYEVDGKANGSVTANTNATVLAALAFTVHGPLHHPMK